MAYTPAEVDETVHLILMENPTIPMKEAWPQAREIHPGLSLPDFTDAWIAYRGMDRIAPWKKI